MIDGQDIQLPYQRYEVRQKDVPNARVVVSVQPLRSSRLVISSNPNPTTTFTC
jgi:hypothetical protein